MIKSLSYGFVCFVLLAATRCQPSSTHAPIVLPDKMDGLSFVAPPRPFQGNPMNEVKAVKAGWIAVIPYGFTRMGMASVHYEPAGWKWWGERLEGVQATIDSAHRAGIEVMLKPQIYVPGGWTGSLTFANEADWKAWERDYEVYLMRFVEIAESQHVELLCIGTEFGIGAKERPEFWRKLIQDIRKKYKGKLTYAANWDDYETVDFWSELDYVGINAYFPLTDSPTPTVSQLTEHWQPILKNIRRYQQEVGKPILFTEYGYLTVDGCAGKTWELEKQVKSLNVNEQAQANAIEALLATFQKEPWWAGGFLWKWFPENSGHEGYMERDYTPQGKRSAEVLRKWYGAKR